MKNAKEEMNAAGVRVTYQLLLSAIDRLHGPNAVSPNRLSKYVDELQLSWKKPVVRERKKRSPLRERVAAEFLLKSRRWGSIKHLWFFDEKPLKPNSVPSKAVGTPGVELVIEKSEGNQTHWSQLTLCNSVKGFIILDLIQHPPSKLVSPFYFLS